MGFPHGQARGTALDDEVPVPEGAKGAMCWSPYDESSPVEEQRVFHWDPEFFSPYTGDVSRGETSQTVNEYKAQRPPKYGTGGKSVIYLLPLGPCWSHSFAAQAAEAAKQQNSISGRGKRKEDNLPAIIPPQLDLLRRYIEAFFHGIPVVLLDPVPLPTGKKKAGPNGEPVAEVRSRINENNPPSRRTQKYAPDLVEFVRTKSPSDAWCVVGITHHDLYASTASNHTIGAHSVPGICVMSFARLDPAFYGASRAFQPKKLIKSADENDGTEGRGGASASQSKQTTSADHWYLWMIKRVCRVLSHEMLHALSIRHCTIFECLMNAEGLHDVDVMGKSLLCPICLKKFQIMTSIDVLRRYQSIAAFCHDFQFIYGAEGMWVCGRFEWIARGLSRIRLPVSSPTPVSEYRFEEDPYRLKHEPPTQAITATVPLAKPAPSQNTSQKFSRRSSQQARQDNAAMAETAFARNGTWCLTCNG
eukprot:TRINITY_DN15756_c0_g1_i1.p1 TRINITY_DN15756_c0_g1~~TRINITY_DN15756_c0_g1_i1.p1  ORF type:complete len:475 (+),score=154.77 TRINITY_DN15756_c0_g1_i1:51-1475(+)